MPDIRHRVVIAAPLTDVYEALSTPEGIAGWWTRDGVRGESAVGSKLEFYFDGPDPAAVMEVTSLDPATGVRWSCVAGADEWVGTTLAFDLSDAGGETVVMFAHEGWREASEFMAHCSARWAYFVLSAKLLCETGAGTPFPDDLKF
jgi:uncharacterized protein YndB with AHSA1/START domain